MERPLWYLAKGLEGLGLLVVLWGLILSISLGVGEEGLQSMKVEGYALLAGGLLFVLGWALERRLGSR